LAVGKRTADLKEELHDVMKKLEDNSSAHTELRRLVETGLIQLEELEEKHNIFKKQNQSLRKDELIAKDKLMDMRNQINELKRRLRKSNVPGVPTYIWNV